MYCTMHFTFRLMLGLELGSTLGMSEFIKLGDRVGLPVPLGESLGCKLGSSDGILRFHMHCTTTNHQNQLKVNVKVRCGKGGEGEQLYCTS
jgi:hypothetical protein